MGSDGGFWFWEFGVALFSVVCAMGLVDLGVSGLMCLMSCGSLLFFGGFDIGRFKVEFWVICCLVLFVCLVFSWIWCNLGFDFLVLGCL